MNMSFPTQLKYPLILWWKTVFVEAMIHLFLDSLMNKKIIWNRNHL